MDENLIARIEKLEKDVETLFKSNNDNSTRLTRIETKLDYISTSIEKLEKSVREYSERPAKRYDTLVTSSISAIIAGIVAFFIGKFTK
jgi:peptidoglycan hydrolase CwlO-like protein